MGMRDHFVEGDAGFASRGGISPSHSPSQPPRLRPLSCSSSFMKTQTARDVRRAFPLLLTLSLGLAVADVRAQGVQHLSIPQPGGMPGRAVVTGIERTTNGVRVTWDGPAGYYQLQQKPGLSSGSWQAVGKATNLVRHATITTLTSNAFFRVAGPAPRYAGAEACADCHGAIHANEMNTRHAGALETLRRQGQDKNPSCLPCHTVGYGLPTGFSERDSRTWHLGGVQCENCHGPAANHVDNENDVTVRPRVELAAQVCGGCHNEGSHRPHFEQWSASAHRIVTEDMNPTNRINSCGRCHSGSARLALLNRQDPSLAVANDANVGITCVVCHDPHANTAHPAQLRNPLVSSNDFFLTTSEGFAAKYDPAINVCAQCHNHRGASWTSSSRPPHHSPQYNMLLGSVGELELGSLSATNRQPATHAWLERQCAGCHAQKTGGEGQAHGLMSDHSFRFKGYELCAGCHGSAENAERFAQFLATVVADRMAQVKAGLDRWANERAPTAIQKYGALAWEYDNAGQLSNPAGLPTLRGPRSDADPAKDEQKYIPANIKKARFNLYLVLHDGSHGMHNGPHALKLLNAAHAWVWSELYE